MTDPDRPVGPEGPPNPDGWFTPPPVPPQEPSPDPAAGQSGSAGPSWGPGPYSLPPMGGAVPGWYAYPPSSGGFRAGHVIGAAVGGLMVGLALPLVLLIALGSFVGGGLTESDSSVGFDDYDLTFQVRTKVAVSIRYGVDSDEHTASASADWNHDATVTDFEKGFVEVTVDAKAPADARASCTVLIDGYQVSTAQAAGPGAVARCTG